METDAYLLGTASPELQRLALQNRLWSQTTRDLWDVAGFKRKDHLLELGCGPGFSTLELAQLVGTQGRVLGWDRSDAFLEHLARGAEHKKLSWVETFQGDVSAPIRPDLNSKFDGVFTRWLLCWMKNPEDAIEVALQALRPGGKLVILDYFQYRSLDLLPRNPAFRHGIDAVEAAWRSADGNPDVGMILPGLLEANGFRVEHQKLNTRYATPNDPLWQWPTSFFPDFMQHLVQEGFLDTQSSDNFLAAFQHSQGHPEGMFLTPRMTELVAVKL